MVVSNGDHRIFLCMTIDPRQVLATEGAAAVLAQLESVGYIVQRELIPSFLNALRLCKPFYVQGPAGVGKTALAECLAAAFDLPMFVLQGVEDLTLADTLYRWDTEEQDRWVSQMVTASLQQNPNLDLIELLASLRARKFAKEFLMLGEITKAFDYAATTKQRCLLLVDEVDKLERKIQNMMLALFARGTMRIPRYDGVIGIAEKEYWPIIVVTSNAESPVSHPFRSRHSFAVLPRPKLQDELQILQRKMPTAPRALIAQAALIVSAFRLKSGFVEYPGIREAEDFIRLLWQQEVEVITPDVLANCVGLLVKNEPDYVRFLKRETLEYLIAESEVTHTEVEAFLAQA